MPKIIMYKTPICPYCIKAKNLLEQKGENNIEEIDISKDANALTEMLEKTGGKKTVPQIFINDQYIGGCDDLYALDEANKLDPLLAK